MDIEFTAYFLDYCCTYIINRFTAFYTFHCLKWHGFNRFVLIFSHTQSSPKNLKNLETNLSGLCLARILQNDETGNWQVQSECAKITDSRAARTGTGNGQIWKAGKACWRTPSPCQRRSFWKGCFQGDWPKLPHREVHRGQVCPSGLKKGREKFKMTLNLF